MAYAVRVGKPEMANLSTSLLKKTLATNFGESENKQWSHGLRYATTLSVTEMP